MISVENWFNNQQTVITAWGGSTFFTGVNYFNHLQGDFNIFAFFGWLIGTVFAILAGFSRWNLNRAHEQKINAEAKKLIAEALKIEEPEEKCNEDKCDYKIFYKNFNPVLLKYFKEKGNQD